MKRSVPDICLALFLTLQVTGYNQTADQDKATQKTEQAQGTEKEGAGAEKSSVETEKNSSGTGRTDRRQSAGSSQAGAEAAVNQGGSMIEFKPGMLIKEGVTVPDFTGELMGGASITLSELQGKPVVINFWAAWRGSCVKEIPAFEHLKGDFGDKIGTIVMNCGNDAETAKDFVEESGYTLLIVLNEEYSISMLYPTNSIPYIVVSGAEGKVTHISTGTLDIDAMCGRYKEALGV